MTFSDLGTISSIISLGVSLFVLAEVRKIRNAFTLRVRGPIVIKELGKYSSNISSYLDQFEDFLPQIAGEFARAQAKLKYLQKKLPAGPRTSVKKLRKLIEKCEVTIENKEGVRLVYVEMNQVLEEVKDHQKDLKLGV
jgi:hypothetical protein